MGTIYLTNVPYLGIFRFMKLIDYLRTKEIPDHEFAATVGRSKWAVRKWMYGQRVPRPAEMTSIAKATEGQVTANDFMEAAARPSTEAA